jgi:uncharacterized membrane protein YeaQ/YmgE (transglycosylase-associated protein family)
MQQIIEQVGGRRFLMSMLVGFTTALLTYMEKIDGTTYSLVILGTVGAYITGNTFQKVKTNATNP